MANLKSRFKLLATQSRRGSQGAREVIHTPQFLAYLVILCFERRYSKHNTVVRLKSNILFPSKFFSIPQNNFGLATPLPRLEALATHLLRTPGLANQSDFVYRTHHCNLCNKHIPAGTHHNQHSELRERQRFVHVELRRLLRHQTVKRFWEACAIVFVYVNAVTADTCLDNILMNLVFK